MAALRSDRPLNPVLKSMTALLALTGLTIGAIAVFGDPRAASPVMIQPLFKKSPSHAIALKKGVVTDDDSAYEEVQIIDSEPIPSDAEILDLSRPGAMAAYGGVDGSSEIHIDQPVTPKRAPLVKAPVIGMSQPGPNGPLPVIASDGRTPMQVYARPFSNPGAKPMVALLVGGLGLNAKTTNAAIETLPPEVTLSFVPYSKDLQTWINHARAYGHEVMIEAPMEPFDYPDNDTGPQTLLASAKPDENAKKLSWLMGRAQGYFGLVNYQGGKFASSSAASAQFMSALNDRGLAFVQDGSSSRSAFANAARSASTPFAAADRIVDSQPAAASIDEQLLTLEALALQNGASLGAGFGYPSTIEKAAAWAQGLASKGYALAPVSAVVKARSAQH